MLFGSASFLFEARAWVLAWNSFRTIASVGDGLHFKHTAMIPPCAFDFITGSARSGRPGVVMGFLLSIWHILWLHWSIVCSLLDWSGTWKSRFRETLHRTGTVGIRLGLNSLLITTCGSRTGHGWLPSAVCSSATELFVYRPCTYGMALYSRTYMEWSHLGWSKHLLLWLFSCMAALSL